MLTSSLPILIWIESLTKQSMDHCVTTLVEKYQLSEEDLEQACIKSFRSTPGLVLILFSPQNIDRLVKPGNRIVPHRVLFSSRAGSLGTGVSSNYPGKLVLHRYFCKSPPGHV